MNELIEDKDIETPLIHVLPGTHPILQKTCDMFTFKDPSQVNDSLTVDPMYLHNLLVYNMIMQRGYGLAAPQIGYDKKVFAFGDPNKPETIRVCFNPTIVSRSDAEVNGLESCLSFPNLQLKVKRAFSVRLRYADRHNITQTIALEDIDARAVQHEMDHLDGILFTSLVNSVSLDAAKRKQKKFNRRNK